MFLLKDFAGKKNFGPRSTIAVHLTCVTVKIINGKEEKVPKIRQQHWVSPKEVDKAAAASFRV